MARVADLHDQDAVRPLPKAVRNARIAASGFLRAKEEARLKLVSTTNRRVRQSPGGPVQRSRAATACGDAVRHDPMRPGSNGSSAAAVKRDGTQTS